MILNFCFVISMKGEILLIDEGIGAGDARFAAMAQKKAGELVERSGLMILASHSQALVEQMCSEAILLSGGKVLNKGSVENIFKDYNKIISSNVL
jgi:ABC-2 type transport system ATP-binding protein/lipopolysaccharide transport system ATP-binding protein